MQTLSKYYSDFNNQSPSRGNSYFYALDKALLCSACDSSASALQTGVCYEDLAPNKGLGFVMSGCSSPFLIMDKINTICC